MTPGLTATLFAVPGKVPLYLEGDTVADRPDRREQTVGVASAARTGGPSISPAAPPFPTGCATGSRGRMRCSSTAPCGRTTRWSAWACGRKTGRRMEHMAVTDTMPALADTPLGPAHLRAHEQFEPADRPGQPAGGGSPARVAGRAGRNGDPCKTSKPPRNRARPSRPACARSAPNAITTATRSIARLHGGRLHPGRGSGLGHQPLRRTRRASR